MFFLYLLLFCFHLVYSDIYNVKISTESHVNLVDRRFLSFTVDPKLLFSSIGKYNRKECTCMASALSPAFLRVAGPSTSRLLLNNHTMAIQNNYLHHGSALYPSVDRKQWDKFVKWSKTAGFDLVFALNSDQKTSSGMWDANAAISTLTEADHMGIKDIYWQLGYECKNQTIEEYVNDLETLRVIKETFPREEWKVVGGDVTNCLQPDSKSDFKDYVTLSNDMMDAIFLNGNSSSKELERMSEKDRMKLLRLLSKSDVPLWLTERSRATIELERAAEWLASLGFSARNGFAVHFRDLNEEEIQEPTLSFYMALLFKNLVGERVLDVDMDVSNATLFAHCTSLHHKPVSGALTLYGANMDDEPARFSVKLSKKEEGGDIMQFILSNDKNGNIVVNSRAMYYEGDIRPVVKRVRPYKTLIINLPPKSFGFWVLANTQVEACRDLNIKKEDTMEVLVLSQEQPNAVKVKRSVINDDKSECIGEEFLEEHTEIYKLAEENKALVERVDSINKDLREMQSLHQKRRNNDALNRLRRQAISKDYLQRQTDKLLQKLKDLPFSSNLVSRITEITNNINLSNPFKGGSRRNWRSKRKDNRTKKSIVGSKRGFHQKSKPNDQKSKQFDDKVSLNKDSISKETIRENKNIDSDIYLQKLDSNEIHTRNRRSVDAKSTSRDNEVYSKENYVDTESSENFKLSNIVHKIKDLPSGLFKKNPKDYDDNDRSILEDMSAIVVETKLEDDGAVIKISENPNFGILATTFEDLMTFLSSYNKKLKKIWDVTNFM